MTQESSPMSLMDAIYTRRAIRDYTQDVPDRATVQALLDAAVHAPTALHQELWAFTVIQDKALLQTISDRAIAHTRESKKDATDAVSRKILDYVNTPGFNMFYNAPTLIAIGTTRADAMGTADCWLAAENLMLAARARGLGSCVIGMAIVELNHPETKELLGIPPDVTVLAPLIVGTPASEPSVGMRKPPSIVSWK
ncbi:MAG: nitroreductase family protein [Alphaproteobacteria bacterium]|nr:nitroreductase family protein [Alphaproteobacteria bacterium]